MNDAKAYDKSSNVQIHAAKALIPRLVSQLKCKSGKTVMDFGCGSGYVTKHILLQSLKAVNPEIVRQIYGIDISENMVEFASKNYNDPEITYLAMDIQKDMGLLPGKFDTIFSFFVLHWISDQLDFLEKIYHLLNTGGEICFYFVTTMPPIAVYDILRRDPKWAFYLSDAGKFIPKLFYSSKPAADFSELLKTAGFAIDECSEITHAEVFSDMEEALNHAVAVDPFIGKMPLTVQESYKEAFLQELLPFSRKVQSAQHVSGFAVELELKALVVRAQKL